MQPALIEIRYHIAARTGKVKRHPTHAMQGAGTKVAGRYPKSSGFLAKTYQLRRPRPLVIATDERSDDEEQPEGEPRGRTPWNTQTDNALEGVARTGL